MKNVKIELAFGKVQKALLALVSVAEKPMQDDEIIVDATIQRFEFTIELFWKLLKVILESKGVEVQYPKDVLREAFKGHLIDDEEQWLSMLKDRNLTSHTYDEKLAHEVYERIKAYVPVFMSTLDHLLKLNGD
jgi:nucleotidyltransferase substrate binding protein (TIGR01987 family)